MITTTATSLFSKKTKARVNAGFVSLTYRSDGRWSAVFVENGVYMEASLPGAGEEKIAPLGEPLPEEAFEVKRPPMRGSMAWRARARKKQA